MKITSEVTSHLGKSVHIRPYDAMLQDAMLLSATQETEPKPGDQKMVIPKKKFMISTSASWALSLTLGGEEKVDELRSLIGDAKAIKNRSELEGMRACHIRDGAALSEYFAWLEEELVVKGSRLDEVQAADKLEQIRSFVDPHY